MHQSQMSTRPAAAPKASPRIVKRAPSSQPSGAHADTKTFGVLHGMTMASIAKDVQRLKKK
ncbi:MAG TPA: hypothetical protein VG432_14935 [Gemmatimonadaceae bacterium]|nr:hypothetical protein [Gemmatimonadaceae bacterium]